MSILIYKRTHIGDPNPKGEFGIYDCMGSVRNFEYKAVIGIGGIGTEPRSYHIDGKITWVGVNPIKKRRSSRRNFRGPIVTFQYFVLFDESGPRLHALAPLLAKRMYKGRVRYLLNGYTESERKEAEEIVNWAIKASKRVSSIRFVQHLNNCITGTMFPLPRASEGDAHRATAPAPH